MSGGVINNIIYNNTSLGMYMNYLVLAELVRNNNCQNFQEIFDDMGNFRIPKWKF